MAAADFKHVDKHAGRIQDKVNFRALDMSPGNRTFFDPEPQLVGQKKNLEVEAKAVDAHFGKKGFDGLTSEHFESALGILDVFEENPTDEEIKNDSDGSPVEGYSQDLVFAPEEARAHENVVALRKVRQVFFNLLRRSGPVRIHEQTDISPGPEKTHLNGISFPPVLLQSVDK